MLLNWLMLCENIFINNTERSVFFQNVRNREYIRMSTLGTICLFNFDGNNIYYENIRIFNIYCEHFLFVFIVKQTKTKFWCQHHKNMVGSIKPFWRSLLHTNKETNRQNMFETLSLLKGVFAKNETGYRLNAIKKRFWSLLILLLAVASIRRKLLKTTNTEERSVLTNSERCNIQLGS